VCFISSGTRLLREIPVNMTRAFFERFLAICANSACVCSFPCKKSTSSMQIISALGNTGGSLLLMLHISISRTASQEIIAIRLPVFSRNCFNAWVLPLPLFPSRKNIPHSVPSITRCSSYFVRCVGIGTVILMSSVKYRKVCPV